MAPQVNWSKIKAELNKYSDLETLKGEVQRLGKELRGFDINAHLSPTAKERLKTVESKYQELTRTLHRTQRQVDREVNRALRNLRSHRARAEKGLAMVREAAEKATAEIRTRVMRVAGSRSIKEKTTARKAKKTKTAATGA